jgi:rare lipoprotein A
MIGLKSKLLFGCLAGVSVLLGSCSSLSVDRRPNPNGPAGIKDSSPINVKSITRAGGYYQDDGPDDSPPPQATLLAIADAQPKDEPILDKAYNRPYMALGKTYTPQLDKNEFSQEGVASWYGKQFQGKKTSSGEPYDMYAMTAAHPTLPIPSYVRVTNLENQKQVIVKVNDRGPFHGGRVIDLSYTAALKLGYLQKGSTHVRVERIVGDELVAAASTPVQVVAVKPNRKKPELNQTNTQESSVAAAVPIINQPGVISVAALPSENKQDTPQKTSSTNIVSLPEKPTGSPPQSFLQMGNFSTPEAAQDMIDRFSSQIKTSLAVLKSNGAYKVVAGPFGDMGQLRQKQQQLREAGFSSFLLKR